MPSHSLVHRPFLNSPPIADVWAISPEHQTGFQSGGQVQRMKSANHHLPVINDFKMGVLCSLKTTLSTGNGFRSLGSRPLGAPYNSINGRTVSGRNSQAAHSKTGRY